MSHPRDTETPDGIELDEFGDRELENELQEYVKFVVKVEQTDESTAEDFLDKLQRENPDWETMAVHAPEQDDYYIECKRTAMDFSKIEEPPGEEERNEERRAEWYKNQYEASRTE